MTYEEKIREIEKELKKDGMEDIHFTFAPNVHEFTDEEIFKDVYEAMLEVKKLNSLSNEERMKNDIEIAYVDAKRAFDCLSYNRINEIGYEEMEKRMWKAWGSLEFALLHLGNWLTLEDKRRLNKDIKEQHKINNSEEYHKEFKF